MFEHALSKTIKDTANLCMAVDFLITHLKEPAAGLQSLMGGGIANAWPLPLLNPAGHPCNSFMMFFLDMQKLLTKYLEGVLKPGFLRSLSEECQEQTKVYNLHQACEALGSQMPCPSIRCSQRNLH